MALQVPSTFEEFLSLLKDHAWLDIDTAGIDKLFRFIRKNRLEQRYMQAIRKTYKNPTWDFERDINCAEPASFITCFIDWEADPDNNWREINVFWQEFE